MSRATDAILAFGIDLGGDNWDWNIEGVDKYDDWVPDELGYAPNDYSEYIEAKLPEGVQLVTYCSDAAPRYILATDVFESRRGQVVEPVMVVTAGARSLLQTACDRLGIVSTQPRPKWMLVSYADGF